jgi:hypothetical protein
MTGTKVSWKVLVKWFLMKAWSKHCVLSKANPDVSIWIFYLPSL